MTHNLFGLDIDERAVQLASFAVLMKARAKNSRILRNPPALNLVTVRSTRHLANQLASSQLTTTAPASPAPLINHQLALGEVRSVQLPIVQQTHEPRLGAVLSELLTAFEDADHLGSLITPPAFDAAVLYAELEAMEQTAPVFVELFVALRHVVKQAELLRKQYWVVVANPPYMGDGSFSDVVKEFINRRYKSGKGDLYGAFILRNLQLCTSNGSIAMLTIPNWMFLSTFEGLRKFILQNYLLESLIHNGRGVFGSDFGSCSFTIRKHIAKGELGTFKRLFEKQGSVASNEELEQRFFISKNYYINPLAFNKIPGGSIGYWLSQSVFRVFQENPPIAEIASSSNGIQTGKNDELVRYWHEINLRDYNIKWFPYNKGGEYRKWYGNHDFLVDWENEGQKIKSRSNSCTRGEEYYFCKGITWSDVTSGKLSCRILPPGFLFDAAGPSAFFKSEEYLLLTLSVMNTRFIQDMSVIFNPTLHFQSGDFRKLPSPEKYACESISRIVEKSVGISQSDWDNFETSWDFKTHPLLRDKTIYQLSQAFTTWKTKSDQAFQQLKQLEEENNRYWIDAYGLQDELTPDVPDEQITIRRADLPRDIKSLLSYAVGCMMGRYSLDHPGLIHAGQSFDPSQHTTFPADSDAILPITDQAYFDDDIVSRFVEFIKAAYGDTHLRANLDFIAHALTLRDGESAQDRIRRYFLTDFISDHIQTYKKRPIYWLFTSGKNRAFGALVYLHRYTPNTVAQIRTDYVLELQRKLAGEIDRTQTRFEEATSSTAKKAIQRRLKTLSDQNAELALYQAKLQTVADRRIHLDLDDGVAYNYTRFKGLVYEGNDLKMADLEKKAQWKLDLLKSVAASETAVK